MKRLFTVTLLVDDKYCKTYHSSDLDELLARLPNNVAKSDLVYYGKDVVYSGDTKLDYRYTYFFI